MIRWCAGTCRRGNSFRPSCLGLAESWEVSKDDHTKWIFHLRRGVKFHDGTDFNADAVIWNWDALKNKDAPQYDPTQAGADRRTRITVIKSWRKLDEYTVEFTTTRPSSFVPYQLVYVFYVSPTQWEKVGRDWRALANNPAGTGPFKLARLVPRERAELEPNRDYWDKKRAFPMADKVVLLPHAGGDHPLGGAAQWTGGLDRSATTRCHSWAATGRLSDHAYGPTHITGPIA